MWREQEQETQRKERWGERNARNWSVGGRVAEGRLGLLDRALEIRSFADILDVMTLCF